MENDIKNPKYSKSAKNFALYLLAALNTYQLGNKSIDRIYKELQKNATDINPLILELADRVLKDYAKIIDVSVNVLFEKPDHTNH